MQRLFPDGIAVTRATCTDLRAGKGAYILLLELSAPFAGRFGGTDFTLEAGRYAYCGSANGSGGLAARLGRHFRSDKNPHWHVDQLSLAASELTALAFPDGSECALADALHKAGATYPLPGFGSSDCRLCTSHLLRIS